MEKINDAVAGNIRQIREKRRMSLDNLAAVTGVSKSMLAQIERGNANPTISTVWKIANGLKISFTQLVTRPEQDIEIIEVDAVTALIGDDDRFRNYPLFPYEDSRPFDLYYLEIDPGGTLQSEAHQEGTQEFILVCEGALEIVVNDQTLAANPSRAVRFRADCPHCYQNNGDVVCKLHMVISYT